jgi:hypothetical protein
MISKNRIPRILGLIMIVVVSVGQCRSRQNADKKLTLSYSGDGTTVVRFCDLDEESYFHVPLIFRAVKTGDPRLNTAPMVLHEGRTSYISAVELDELVQKLAHSDLSWEHSERVESIKWDLAKRHLPCSTEMEFLVISGTKSARAKVSREKICAELEALDSTLHTPRALWEFQLFRQGYSCKVPGFKYDAYPDHSH